MKFIILQSNIAKGLNNVSRIVSSRTTLPVLSNILVSAKKGKITFSSTDLEVGITTLTNGKVEEEGELTAPARLLSDFILNNNDESVAVGVENNQMTLKSDKFEAKITGISAEEFPTIPDSPKEIYCTISRDEFLNALKKVLIATATDETRPTLAGVYFDFAGKKLTLAATDSYRLAENKIVLDEEVAEKKAIVPTRTMTEVMRLLSTENVEKIKIAFTENQVFFMIGETRLVSRIIEGAFPPYAQIIPKDFKVKVLVDYKEFVSALKMVSLFAKDAANNIKLTTKKEELTVASAETQSGGANSHIKAKTEGGEIEVSFNVRYLQDVLQVVSTDSVIIKLNDSAAAALIEFEKEKGFLYIVMPLKTD